MNTPAKKPRRKADIPDPLAGEQQQRELAPAAVAPAANDAARAAIATINTQLSEFDKVEAGLGELERKYKGVAYPVDTKQGMDEAVLARREVKGVRVDVEHAREAAKAPVLKLGRDIDERAGTIKTRLLAIETPIDDQIKAQERKEAERKADLERRVTEIRATPARCIGKTAAQLQEVLDALNSLPLESFAEYREQAAKAQFDAQQAVGTLLQQAKQAEELARLQELQRKEDARKAAIQQAIDAIGAPLQQLPMCRTSTRVQALVDNAAAIEIAEAVYQEFAPAAREKKAAVLAELTRARDEKKAAEDARAAAAAPAPTPAPAPDPAIMAGTRAFTSGVLGQLQNEQPLTAERTTVDGLPPGAARIYPDEPRESLRTGPGRKLASDFDRVFGSAPPAATPAPSTEIASSTTQRPNDGEMLAVLADHYEVDLATVAGWLRAFDADAALRQLALPV